MSFLDLCINDYLIQNKEQHREKFIEYITQQRQSVIEAIKDLTGYNKVNFYYYVYSYCPEQYAHFLPDLIEDFVDKASSHYVNGVSRSLFTQIPKQQQYEIAYQVLEKQDTCFALQKQLIRFLYDDAVDNLLRKDGAKVQLLHLQDCLKKMRDLHQNPKILYEIDLYLTHIASEFHQTTYLNHLPAQPNLFPYAHRNTRLTYAVHYLTSLSLLEELRLVAQLTPKSMMVLLQFAIEETDPQLRLKAQYALSSYKDLQAHIAVVLRSSETTYKKHALQWLLLKDCQIQMTQNELTDLLKKDKSQRFSPYIYQLSLKYNYDLKGYFDQDSIIKNAELQLKKIPVSLQWLNMDDLPDLYWQNQQPIAKSVVYGWLCQAASVTDLTHHENFQLYMNFLSPESQFTLSRFVMTRFIAQDLQQSAAKCKGILVFTTALPLAEHWQYVQEHFKNAQQHVPQLKAMLETLLRSDDPEAILYLLNAKGFARKPTIDEYRIELLKLITEEHGISRPQHFNPLFTPTLGFNSISQTQYFYQDQTFTLSITPELKLLLTDAKDKKIAKLPKAKTAEEQQKWDVLTLEIQEKTQKFSALTKELKSEYRKMCKLPTVYFSYEDWINLMFYHPILRYVSERLVWEMRGSDGSITQCMATAEGDFVDAENIKLDFDHNSLFYLSLRGNWGKDWDARWLNVFKAQQRLHLWNKTE